MHRRKLLSPVLAPAVMVVALLALACGGATAEQQILRRYFEASRMRDNTTLGNIATVSFRPQEEGVVQSFDIESVGEEQRRVLQVKEFAADYDAKRQADEEFSKRKKAYQDENIEAIDRVLRAEREGRTLRGRDLQVQQEWTKWREEMAQHAKEVSEAREALGAERSIAELSTFNPANPINASEYDGELITKDLTINARVRMPDEQTVEKQLVVTMRRAELKGPAGEVSGRWIVTALRDVTS